MDLSIFCLVAGPIISGAVSIFKKIPLVNKYPKSTAFVLSTITAGASTLWTGDTSVGQLIECTLIPFAGAVTTYEAGTRQVKKVLVTDSDI